MKWRTAVLGEVADVNWGDTSVTKKSYASEGYTAFSATGPDGYLPYHDFDRDGIVLSAIGARCGKTWFASGKWPVIKNTIRFWSEYEYLDNRFLYWLTADPDFWPKRGAAQPFITIGDARSLEIPLPPLEEQKRIAGILDQAASLYRLRTHALDKLNTLGQAIFHEMFGDLIANARHYPIATIGDVIAGFETGKNLAEDPDADRPDGYRVLKISAVTSGQFRPEESKPLPLSYEPPVTHIVREGDLLFSRANTAQLIGATAFVQTTSGNLVLPDKLWRFVWKIDSLVLPVFVKALFSSPAFRYEIGRRSSGTSGSMKNIGKQKVMSIAFGLPPLGDQSAFVRKLSELEMLLASCGNQKNQAETLFASLQQRAFRGEL